MKNGNQRTVPGSCKVGRYSDVASEKLRLGELSNLLKATGVVTEVVIHK